ncbi:MAG: hypothetical protein RLZZ70_706 [Candidatus Parcubacteria bacterium]
MWIPFVYLTGFIVAFIAFLLLCEYEDRRGERVALARVRASLDFYITVLTNRLERMVRYVVRYVITLSWYYSLHATLKIVLASIAGVYHMLEAVLINNRERARALRKEKRSASHLEQIAEHKAESKLTYAEAKKRKDKALRGQ